MDLEVKYDRHRRENKGYNRDIVLTREFTSGFDKKQSTMDFSLSVYLDLERQQFTKRETNACFNRPTIESIIRKASNVCVLSFHESKIFCNARILLNYKQPM